MDEPAATKNETPDDALPTAGSAERAQRNPEEWVTGDQPMTEAQAALLRRLCKEAGEPFEPDLSRSHAAERIEALQHATGKPSPSLLVNDQTDG
jgi:DUF3072 family protein